MNILFVTTVSTTMNAFMIPLVELLACEGHTVDFACQITQPIKSELAKIASTYYDIPIQRTPFTFRNISAYRQIARLLKQKHYDIVHCHTPVASMLTRLACRKYRKKGLKLLYTAHGFHFFSGAPLVNWVTYFPIEWFLSRYTDVLITINKEDYLRAKTLRAKKVLHVPGVGVDIQAIIERDKGNNFKLRNEFGVPADAFVMLSVGEINKNKNHRVAIEALARLEGLAVYYVICGEGKLMDQRRELASSLGVADRVIFTGFRRDVLDFYEMADIFVFPSFREGLSVSLMEAMASGLPCVVSRIRGNTDLVADGVGGIHCAANRPDDFSAAIARLLGDRELRYTMCQANRERIGEYDVTRVKDQMLRVYREVSAL